MAQYKGASRQHEVKASRRRKDTRLFGQKFSDFFNSGDGVVLGLSCCPSSLVLVKVPLSGELMLLIAWMYGRSFVRTDKRSFDFPYRAAAGEGKGWFHAGGKEIGKGVTMIGNDLETKEQIYAGDSDLRTHMLVLGTTGSGKTEFLLGLVFNALVQNTGFIYVDGKGDPKLQKEIFRLSRYLGRRTICSSSTSSPPGATSWRSSPTR
ncbi:FtsK/SpoIIIE domain-containing protein [Aeromonas veronii]|uniref:FtsK/SpoIIIE domain-containing protein n=1 Tax=Aeromonas veronii TaxID=654 RepID=UPI001F0A66B0|nr:FtsK/SpoIIIE domain-containing protein [Aeromonas veronii]